MTAITASLCIAAMQAVNLGLDMGKNETRLEEGGLQRYRKFRIRMVSTRSWIMFFRKTVGIYIYIIQIQFLSFNI